MPKEASLARRHFLIPDAQCKPGAPMDHIDWIAQALVDYQPDVVVNIGDWWDMPSLSMHDPKGSLQLEGARYEDDVAAGNDAYRRLNAPMAKEIKRQSRNKRPWKPERHITFGNHDQARIERAINADPKFLGAIGMHHLDTCGWQRHDFLERLWLDGIVYSHYFQAANSPYAIGGSIDNRLNKIGDSFVQGHQQGFQYGSRVYPTGKMRHGLVAGSCYLHREAYRGNQGQRHWRGVVVLNEVRDGDYCLMPLSLDYLARRYEGVGVREYMEAKYPKGDWSHL